MTDRCPCCRRELADLGPLPSGSVRLCPCRVKPAFAPPPARRGVEPNYASLRLRIARAIARHGPLTKHQVSSHCAATPQRLAEVFTRSGWFRWLDGLWSLTSAGRDGLAAAEDAS